MFSEKFSNKLAIFAAMIFCLALFGLNSSATAQQSARFRVTLNGFTVNNQSDDDIFEGDGKGDEVYLRADNMKVSATDAVEQGVKQTVKSIVVGDVNNHPERGQAGSASAKGGLRTGDKFPPATAQPWARGAALARDRAPMQIWEGTLTQGVDGVVILPTVWEWDSPNVSRSEADWDTNIHVVLDTIGDILKTRIRSRDRTASLDSTTVFPAGQGDAAQDPRGIYISDDKSGTRPIGILQGPRRFVFFLPQFLLFSYDSALAAATTSPDNLGIGVFAIRYKDNRDHGDYTLYIQVEKIN